MTLITFVLGALLGTAICLWKQYQFKRQLRQILFSLTKSPDLINSLSIASLIRREINRLVGERHYLEEELQVWQWLLDRASIGYLRIDEENQLLWCNQEARRLLRIDRWQPGQLRLLLELVRSYELDQLIEQTRHSQQAQTQEWVYYTTSHRLVAEEKGPYSLALKASSYPLPKGQVGVFLENQQPLVELSQSRDRAFSDLAHELRTPLTSIALVAETLQKRLQHPEQRWIEQSLQETHRLIELVQSWLEISQLNQDPAQQLHYQSVELRELIFYSWQVLEPLSKKKEVTLVYSGPEYLTIRADPSRLTQIFLNLFDNGIKHSPPQEVIRVFVEILEDATDKSYPIQKSTVAREFPHEPVEGRKRFRPQPLPKTPLLHRETTVPGSQAPDSAGQRAEAGDSNYDHGLHRDNLGGQQRAELDSASGTREFHSRAFVNAALPRQTIDRDEFTSPPASSCKLPGRNSSDDPLPADDQHSAGRFVQIDIIDLGEGFAESDLPYIFERLYRGDLSRERQSFSASSSGVASRRGSGLGLSIVQQIVRAHGGAIVAKNHPNTGGAWLQIILPVC